MDDVLKWMAIHPIRVDIVVFGVVAGTIAYILKRHRRRRRVYHRKLWAMWLKRKDIEAYHLMKFEDAITDAAFEMVHSGEMTEKQEQQWYAFFAERYDMKGMIPRRDRATFIRGSLLRIKRLQNSKKPDIPGGPPGCKVDPTYDPKPVMKSKYVRE